MIPDYQDYNKTYTRVGKDVYISSDLDEQGFLIYVDPYALQVPAEVQKKFGVAVMSRKMKGVLDGQHTFSNGDNLLFPLSCCLTSISLVISSLDIIILDHSVDKDESDQLV
jgi:hypothetical protein